MGSIYVAVGGFYERKNDILLISYLYIFCIYISYASSLSLTQPRHLHTSISQGWFVSLVAGLVTRLLNVQREREMGPSVTTKQERQRLHRCVKRIWVHQTAG